MPPLHGDRMRIYGAIIQDAARTHLSKIANGAVFSALTLAQDVTLDIIIRAVFGVDDSHEVAEVRDAITAKLEASTPWLMFFSALRRPMFGVGPWDHFLKADKNARRLLHRTIEAKRTSTTRGADILSLLLDARYEDGSPMPDDDIVDELITLLFAGHETTAITLAWAMYWLHAKPELLERLNAELAAAGNRHPRMKSQSCLTSPRLWMKPYVFTRWSRLFHASLNKILSWAVGCCQRGVRLASR
jgi:cytochrome P450